MSNFLDRIRGALHLGGGEGAGGRGADTQTGTAPRRVVRIDFDAMLKGSVYERPSGKVKQYGVTVDGATKVVTSGDYVDRDTYDALLRANAIRSMNESAPANPDSQQTKRRQRQTS